MSSVRRVNDRRRRVLYSAQHADQHAPTAASRSEARRLREARRPQEAYGSHVHRRLRGRWFSLVPVRRRSISVVVGAVMSAAILLCAAHYAAVSWTSIAYRPDLARPLRLDRPDSFGHCMMVALLTASTGASLLIYQLRRYRNDDFKGQYRLWRLVMIVMFLASINAMVGMIDWGGAILDTLFGKRVALTGSDWIRLVVSLGGAVLAIRLIAEVRRCRVSLGLMIAACMLLAIPEAAKWNVMTVDSLRRWILVTSAPLFACTALFLSLGIYLRMLYREVRQIVDGESVVERFRQYTARWLHRSGQDDDGPQATTRSTPLKSEAKTEQPARDAGDDDSEQAKHLAPVTEQARKPDGGGQRQPKAKRRWFGLRRAKPETSTADGKTDRHEEHQEGHEGDTPKTPVSPPSPAKQPSRFSLRLKPRAVTAATPASRDPASRDPASGDSASQAAQDTKAEQPTASKSKRSLGLGWFRRGKASTTESTANPSGRNASTARPSSQPQSHVSDESDLESDDVDWDSLNKTERRRLRKQLKRQNRAA